MQNQKLPIARIMLYVCVSVNERFVDCHVALVGPPCFAFCEIAK